MPNFEIEEKLLSQEYSLIGGGDEAGRGALAGPVVAAIVVLNPKKINKSIDDSKKLSKEKRKLLLKEIKVAAISYGIGIVSEFIIDKINVLQATKLAMVKAYESMLVKPDYLLLDALNISAIKVKQASIVKGDEKSYSIAAASILAKVTRDDLMETFDKIYPDYGFGKHKGYGVKVHRNNIQELGSCNIHRKTFKPISELVEKVKEK